MSTRLPFSLERLIRVTPEGKVLYLAEKKTPRRFPRPASQHLFGGVARNFQLFDPLDFIAELTQHIPDTRKHLGRSFGFYSNKARGRRAKAGGAHLRPVEIDDRHTPRAIHARRRWAALIKQVWRVDPSICTRCGARMRIVAFIQPAQRAVIEKLLRHCRLWDQRSRAPPLHDQGRSQRYARSSTTSLMRVRLLRAQPPGRGAASTSASFARHARKYGQLGAA